MSFSLTKSKYSVFFIIFNSIEFHESTNVHNTWYSMIFQLRMYRFNSLHVILRLNNAIQQNNALEQKLRKSKKKLKEGITLYKDILLFSLYKKKHMKMSVGKMFAFGLIGINLPTLNIWTLWLEKHVKGSKFDNRIHSN